MMWALLALDLKRDGSGWPWFNWFGGMGQGLNLVGAMLQWSTQ